MTVFQSMTKFKVWKSDQDLKTSLDLETNNFTPFLDFTISKCSHIPEPCEGLCKTKYINKSC